jgi:hypothetical protein
MLWYKNWLETRWVFLFALAVPLLLLPLIAQHIGDSLPEADNAMRQTGPFWIFAAAMLAGAGIRTRSGIRNKGVNGSMYYLLSMPASRASLFASRVGLGFVELAGVIVVVCAANWLAVPVLRANADPSDMLRYGLVVLVCASAFYFLAVLAASLIDDEMGKTWGSFIAGGVLLWIARRAGMPPAFDLWSATLETSPLHSSIPWTAMGVSALLSTLLALAAVSVVQSREYSA